MISKKKKPVAPSPLPCFVINGIKMPYRDQFIELTKYSPARLIDDPDDLLKQRLLPIISTGSLDEPSFLLSSFLRNRSDFEYTFSRFEEELKAKGYPELKKAPSRSYFYINIMDNYLGKIAVQRPTTKLLEAEGAIELAMLHKTQYMNIQFPELAMIKYLKWFKRCESSAGAIALAAQVGHDSMRELLLSWVVDESTTSKMINDMPNNKYNTVHALAGGKSSQIEVDWLAQLDPDLSIKDDAGMTPIQIAEKAGNQTFLDAFVKIKTSAAKNSTASKTVAQKSATKKSASKKSAQRKAVKKSAAKKPAKKK